MACKLSVLVLVLVEGVWREMASNKVRAGNPSLFFLACNIFGAFLWISLLFTGTGILHQPSQKCTFSIESQKDLYHPSGRYRHYGTFGDVFGSSKSWPDEGYGTQLSLRIYVYEESEIPGLKELLHGRDHKIVVESCLKGQWGMQVKIHKLLLQSKFRVMEKDDAQLFFVPSYVKCVRMNGGLNDKEINAAFIKVIQHMPYFRHSGGRDHVFVFPSGAGAHLFKDWSIYLNRSIFLTPEGDRTDKRGTTAFNTWKDIIIPGNVDDSFSLSQPSSADQMVKPLPLSGRKYLANYLGRAQGKTGRLKLLELAQRFPNKLEAPELSFSGPTKFSRREYFEHLRNAKFCLAPRGESSWTLRFYESFFVECVPVLLSDQVELPFQNVLDYTGFSIKWPSTRIGEELFSYLESISDAEIEKMLGRGRAVRCLFVYAPENEGCSAMMGILWELQRKVRLFHQSPHTFWLHNGTIVNQDLTPINKWRPPFIVP